MHSSFILSKGESEFSVQCAQTIHLRVFYYYYYIEIGAIAIQLRIIAPKVVVIMAEKTN